MLLHENTHKGLGISQLSLVQGNFLGTLFNFLWSRLHLKNCKFTATHSYPSNTKP